jgi:RNA polymerase sigma-70 factor (ECF subfamily)
MGENWTRCSDGELLRAVPRDADAFAELYLRYEAVVLRSLVGRTRDREVAADLTAETFATAFLQAARFRDDGGPAVGWLLAIAHHAFLMTLRRGRTEARARERLGVQLAPWSDASLDRIDALVDLTADAHPLRRALATLPDAQRDAVLHYVVGDQTYQELATALDLPQATVRQRVSRGLTRLRSQMEGQQS